MSLSKRSIAENRSTVTFDVETLSERLRIDHPEIVFALILGSATNGTVKPGSDLDIAVYFRERPGWDQLYEVTQSVENVAPGVPVDLGVLNGSEPVYRFEALKGRLLFTADQEAWLHFYSLTCREYEHWMWHYQKQLRYWLSRRSSDRQYGDCGKD